MTLRSKQAASCFSQPAFIYYSTCGWGLPVSTMRRSVSTPAAFELWNQKASPTRECDLAQRSIPSLDGDEGVVVSTAELHVTGFEINTGFEIIASPRVRKSKSVSFNSLRHIVNVPSCSDMTQLQKETMWYVVCWRTKQAASHCHCHC
jgi:hypothetical protein